MFQFVIDTIPRQIKCDLVEDLSPFDSSHSRTSTPLRIIRGNCHQIRFDPNDPPMTLPILRERRTGSGRQFGKYTSTAQKMKSYKP